MVALATLEDMTRRAISSRCPGEIALMRLFPRRRHKRALRWRRFKAMMQPTMPRRRHGTGLAGTRIDDPSPLTASRRKATRAVIPVPEFVVADVGPSECGKQASANSGHKAELSRSYQAPPSWPRQCRADIACCPGFRPVPSPFADRSIYRLLTRSFGPKLTPTQKKMWPNYGFDVYVLL